MNTVQNVATTDAPSLTVHNGNIWMAWKGEQGDKGVYVCHTDGTKPANASSGSYSFSPQQKVLEITTVLSPAIVSYSNTLYLFWRSETGGEIYWASSPDGQTWTDLGPVPIGYTLTPSSEQHAVTDHSPSAATDGQVLYLCWSNAGAIWYAANIIPGGYWAFQTQIVPASGGTPKTNNSPAIATHNGVVHVVWEGANSSGLYWSSSNNPFNGNQFNAYQPWTPQQLIFKDEILGAPNMAVSGNGLIWLTWPKPPYNKLDWWTPAWIPAPGTDYWNSNHLAFASLKPGAKQWSAEAVRTGITPGTRTAMASYGSYHYDILMAWSDQYQAIYYGPLGTPSRSYQFGFEQILCQTARSGNALVGKGTDTDYAAMSVQASGGSDKPITQTVNIGNISGGQNRTQSFFSPLPPVSVPDNAQLVMTYNIVNSSQPESQAVQKILSATETVATTAATAAGTLAGDALGAAIGAAIGTDTIPLIGSAVGALAGFLAEEFLGLISDVFPNCDGPIGSAVRAITAADLATLPKGGAAIEDQQPSPNMQPPMVTRDGCGSNPNYYVSWSVTPAS